MTESEQAGFQLVKGDRGVTGERGPHGDHGQDGKPGPQGVPGRPGITGRRGRNIKGTDIRLVFLLVYVTVAVTGAYLLLQHTIDVSHDAQAKVQVQVQRQLRVLQDAEEKLSQQQRQLVVNCVTTNRAAAAFNSALDQAILNSKNSTGLTRAQKQAALKRYSKLHLPISPCPPVG